MEKIEVDFEIFQELTALRDSATSCNDVIRQLLAAQRSAEIPRTLQNSITTQNPTASPPQPSSSSGGLYYKRVFFPNGTRLRAYHRGQKHTAEVRGGLFDVNGKTAGSPSAAAFHITEQPTNGWKFWEVKRPGDKEWSSIERLRSKAV